MILVLAIIAGLGVFFAGFAFARLTDRARDPITDAEHADLVHRQATDLNIAMHNARAHGLNPAIRVTPVDPDRPAGHAPLVVTVERTIGTAVERTQR